MDLSFLQYELTDGFVHNWLKAGPQIIPMDGAPDPSDPKMRQAMVHNFYTPEMEIQGQPVVRGKFTDGLFSLGEYQGSWEYMGCQEDHLVNHSGRYQPDHYLRSWVYTQLVSDRAIELQLRLTSPGPADLWLGRRHLLRKETFSLAWPEPVVVPIRLKRGPNPVMARFETFAAGDCAHFLALQVCLPDGTPLDAQTSHASTPRVSVRLPSTIMPRLLEYRQHLEQLFSEIAFERDVFVGEQEIAFRLPDAPYAGEIVTIRVMDLANIIFRDGAMEGKPGQRVPLNYAFELAAGCYQVEFLPRVHEYYELGLRIQKDIQVWTVGNTSCSKQPYGTFSDRRQEGLLKAVEQKNNLFADWARMTLGWWTRVEVEQIQVAIDRVNRGEERDPLRMVSLVGMFCRFADQPQFPAEIRQSLADCILNSNFHTGEPADSEADRILLCTCELLAGQRFPDRVFPQDGQNGDWHAGQGTRMAVDWILKRASLGFEDWGSSEELNRALVALSLLVDLANDGQLQELATVLIDKIFFALAVNSFQGFLGSPQKRVSPLDIRGGILQPTAGIMRLMWGLGVFNHRIEGFVSLACADRYELPEMIAKMATDLPDEMWGQEQHASGQPANKIVYRTPDYLLSSVQDYLPGSDGDQELLWQATLGPGATVFVNNPGCSFEEDGVGARFLAGQCPFAAGGAMEEHPGCDL